MADRSFDDMTEEEQDDVARAKIKEILSKPILENGDAATVAACVAFIGTSKKMADKFSQALLDTAESFVQGLCVRCGETPGAGPNICLICQAIRNVQALKLVKENSHEEMKIPIHKLDGTHVGDLTDEGIIEIPESEEAIIPNVWPEDLSDVEELKAPDPTLCPGKQTAYEVDNPICRSCSLFKRKWGSRPSRCTWRGWGLAVCPGCGLTVPNTVICVSCGTKLEAKQFSIDQETETIKLKVDIEARAPEPLEALAMTPGIKVVDAPVTRPWTDKELEALRVNAHLQPSAIAKYVSTLKRRTPEEIEAKLKEL